jgi:hypothetical protein
VAVSGAVGTRGSADSEVSLLRLYVLRANYLLWVIAGLLLAVPPLIAHGPTERGMIDSMFGGLWVMGIFGLRYPLRMLPIFLFEFVWKTIWLLAFGLPQWLAGAGSPRLSDDLISIGNGPILFGLIIPWGYVWRHYVKQPGDRWRRSAEQTDLNAAAAA